MALAKSAFVAFPETLEGDEWLAEEPNSVDASDMSILSFSSSDAAGTAPEAMAFESSFLPTGSYKMES